MGGPIPPRPAEHEVLAAALHAVLHTQQTGGGPLACHIDSDEFVNASVAARAGLLARAGAHYLLIVRPARQAELKAVADAISTGRDKWSDPVRQVGPARVPVRCDTCHGRLTVKGAAA